MDWKLYLAFALIGPVADAIACVAVRRKFRIVGSLIGGLFWPVTIPVVLIAAAHWTRNMPHTSAKDTK